MSVVVLSQSLRGLRRLEEHVRDLSHALLSPWNAELGEVRVRVELACEARFRCTIVVARFRRRAACAYVEAPDPFVAVERGLWQVRRSLLSPGATSAQTTRVA